MLLLLLSQPHYLVPDSAGHVAWVRSLVWDADFDFANDYERLGMIERETSIEFGATTAAGRRGNPFGIGTGLVWLPFVLAQALLSRVASALGADVTTDGFGTATLLAARLGTWTCVIVAGLLLAASLHLLLPHADRKARRTAVVAALLGTPLVYYVVQMPTYSHAVATFM
ncbi:MAG: hypothetical protein JSW67_01320, partial [Candidatus Latescibacterota bacterium]